MTGYFIITVIVFLAIAVAAQLYFKRMDDRYK